MVFTEQARTRLVAAISSRQELADRTWSDILSVKIRGLILLSPLRNRTVFNHRVDREYTKEIFNVSAFLKISVFLSVLCG